MKKYSIIILVMVVGVLFYQTFFSAAPAALPKTSAPAEQIDKADYAFERTLPSDVATELPRYLEEENSDSVVFIRRGAVRHFITIESAVDG